MEANYQSKNFPAEQFLGKSLLFVIFHFMCVPVFPYLQTYRKNRNLNFHCRFSNVSFFPSILNRLGKLIQDQ
jgi:hypothetical protein